MERWSNRVAVVTGASVGIGAAICKLLCQNGMKVVGCARRVEKIQELKDQGAKTLYPYKCDMSIEDDIRGMFKWIEEHPELGKVDVCIPNAGLSFDKSLLDGNVSEWKTMMDVNVIALNLCTQLAIKSMLKHGVDDGQIVLINSFSGHRVPNGFGGKTHFYSATKFAVTALLEGWRQELRDHVTKNNIRIGQLCPGVVVTEFSQTMNGGDKASADALYSTMECLEAEDMADCVKYILQAPIRMQIHDILVRPTQQKM